MITNKYYDPSRIFLDEGNEPHEMAGSNNIALAVSFYHSRYMDDGEIRSSYNAYRFDRNAGAAQVYNKDGLTVLPQTENAVYNFVSYGNKKEFEDLVEEDSSGETLYSSYGHSERELMKKVLDDLIDADPSCRGVLPCPSDPSNWRSPNLTGRARLYEALRNLTQEPEQYKRYLESRNIIVKMWSERQACNKVLDSGKGLGGHCSEFIEKIFPAGSQFGYIALNYMRGDSEIVRQASEDFKQAYLAYSGRSNANSNVVEDVGEHSRENVENPAERRENDSENEENSVGSFGSSGDFGGSLVGSEESSPENEESPSKKLKKE